MPQLAMLSVGGAEINMTAAAGPPVAGINSSACFAGRTFSRVLQVGRPGYMDGALDTLLPGRITHREVLGKHELVLGHGVGGTGTVVAVRLQRHEVITAFGGPPLLPEKAREVMSLFEFAEDDSDEGVRITALPWTGIAQVWEDITVHVLERGVLQIYDPLGSDRAVPAWGGARTTAGGEVWEVARSSQERRYLLNFPSMAAEFVTDPDARLDDVARWLDELNLNWRNAA